MHLYAFKHKVHSVARCILTHSHSYAFKRMKMHSLTHAFRESADLPRGWLSSKTRMLTRVCILTHSYAFLRILAHSSVLRCIHSHITHTSSQGECRPPKRGWLSSKTRACSLHSCMHSHAFVCIRMHSYVFKCIRIHSFAFFCILMPAACSGRSSPAWKPSWCTRTGSQTWSRSP